MNKKKIVAYMLMLIMAIGLFGGATQSVYAGSGSVSVSVSASSVTTGSTVSVTVGISADEAIGYGIAVSYDTSVLEYQGGGDGGGSGTVTILSEGDGSTASYSRTLTFKAIGTGSSTISTSEFAGGLFGYATGDMSVSYGSATVTVSAPQSNDNTSGNGDSNGGDATTSAELTGSGDNTLKSLEISPGTLSPAFKSGTTSYTVNLPEDTKSIVVSAVPNDSKAKVAVSHNNDLEPGANKTYIVVTAENGTQRTYVLNINCGEVPDDSTDTTDETEEQNTKKITIEGKEYVPATQEELAEVTIPEEFAIGEIDYQGEKLTAYTSPNQQVTIVYLLDADGNGSWFLYQAEKQTFIPYVEFQAAANRYVIIAPDETVSIPEGYTQIEAEIQGHAVTAYAKADDREFLLVYAVNIKGEAGFYLYDTIEETYQRYAASNLVSQPAATEETGSTEETNITGQEQNRHLRTILYVVSGVCVLLLGMIIAIAAEYKKKVLEPEAMAEEDANTAYPENFGWPEMAATEETETIQTETLQEEMSSMEDATIASKEENATEETDEFTDEDI